MASQHLVKKCFVVLIFKCAEIIFTDFVCCKYKFISQKNKLI